MTHFQVQLFHAITDPAPFATTEITAKMPLGALAFGLVRLGTTAAARVDVRSEEGVITFYHVALQEGQLHYTREVTAPAQQDTLSMPGTPPVSGMQRKKRLRRQR